MSARPGSWTTRRRPVHAVGSTVDRGSNGPRFARFAAAMEAEPPPQAQMLPETPDTASAVAAPTFVGPGIRPTAGPTAEPTVTSHAAPVRQDWPPPAGPPDDEPVLDDEPVPDPLPDERAAPDDGAAHGGFGTVTPRRPVIEGRLRGAIPWLGIGSWVLFCGALFVSLLGWPDQTALDRVTGLWSDPASIAHQAPEATTQHAGPTGAELHLLPRAQDDPPPSVTAGSVERPEEVAPDAGPRMVRQPGGPPVPQFKPRVDGVAAKFSSAFFEIGNRLQEQGDFDAALHMRRQGINLDPWKTLGAS